MKAKLVNEAIIIEKDFKLYISHIIKNINNINNLEDLNIFSDKFNIYFSVYKDFFNYLDNEEKEVAPPERMLYFPSIGIRFGLYNKHLNKIHIVVVDPINFIYEIENIIQDPLFSHILKHESIHIQQVAKMSKGKEIYHLKDSPTDSNKYFANKWEIMAFAQSMIDELSQTVDKNYIIQKLKDGSLEHPLYNQIYKNMNREVFNRFRKYAIAYAQKIN